MSVNVALVNVLLTYDVFYIFRYVQLELLFGIGPALFFYTKTITNAQFKFTKKELIHFLPLLLEFIFYRTSFYRLGADGMYQDPVHPYTKIYLTEQWLGILSIGIYAILSLQLLYKHQRWLKEQYSDLATHSQGWLKVPVMIYAGFWIGWNILTEFDRFVFDRALRDIYFLPTFVGLAIVSSWIGFKGYLKSQSEVTETPVIDKTPSTPRPPDDALAQKLATLMETQQPYLNSELNLTKLSQLLEANPKQVSHTINHHFAKNFYEYVNHFRIETFKERVRQKDHEKLSILGHAFECGFKSKSTFNDVFKKTQGQTPSQYIKSLKKESEGANQG